VNTPLFPLHTVLFPGGRLELKVFETRYVDLIRRCLRTGQHFGVVLIAEGAEVGDPARPHAIGTYAELQEVDARGDGLLWVRVQGGGRFRIRSTRSGRDRLLEGEVERLFEPQPDAEPRLPPAVQTLLQELLPALPVDLAQAFHGLDWGLDRGVGQDSDPGSDQGADPRPGVDWMVYRLAELLPLKLRERQAVLAAGDPQARIASLEAALRRLGLL